MLDDITPSVPSQQYPGSFQQLADARRVLKVTNSLRKSPVLLAEERLEIERARATAIRVIESSVQSLIETLDALDDPDLEPNGDELDGDGAEDDFMDHYGAGLPGCPVADPAEYAAPEGVRQRQYKQSLPHEDAEEDDEDCSGFEDEPLFDRGQCERLNARYGDGPGGGQLLDSDRGDGGV